MHHREENNHHRPDHQNVRDNFAFIELRAENSRRFRNFVILGRETTFAIRLPPEGTDIVRWIESAFCEIRAYALRSCESNDYVGLSFESADLARSPAGLSFRPARDLTHEDIWQLVSSWRKVLEGLISQKILQYMFSKSQYQPVAGVNLID